MLLLIDGVYPGYAVSENGLGYVYSTVYYPAVPGHFNRDGYGNSFDVRQAAGHSGKGE